MKHWTEMTTREARALDRPGVFYVDLIENDSADWGIFGSETGFCYGIFDSKEAAEPIAKAMNDQNKEKQTG